MPAESERRGRREKENMVKKRRGIFGILFGRPAAQEDSTALMQENNVSSASHFDGDTLVELIGQTLMQSITHLSLSNSDAYNVEHFQYYNEFRNCLLHEEYAQFIAGDVRKRLGRYINAQPYIRQINELHYADLEEAVKHTVVKYQGKIEDFWKHYQEEHRKLVESNSSTNTNIV